jgi:SlyX protein
MSETDGSDAIDSANLNDVIADLQMRLTYQEDEIQHLNRVLDGQRVTLDQQALQIEQLRRLVVSLSEGLREQVSDAPPPHY